MDIKLKLKEESWQILLSISTVNRNKALSSEVKRYHDIKKYLTDQLKMCTSQGVNDIDNIINPAQIDLFNQD